MSADYAIRPKFHWLLAHRLFTGHNRAMSQAQPGHEETTARGEAGPAVI